MQAARSIVNHAALFTKGRFLKSNRMGGIAGLLGVGIILAGTMLTAAVYQGRSGESYSPFNHFVSELGQFHVSAWAMLFNLSLIVGNACLVPFTLSLARQLGGTAAHVFRVVGLIANLSGGFVGVLPMNILLPHLLVAMTFFYTCLGSAIIFTVHAILFTQDRLGRWIAVSGLFTVACFVVFIGETICMRHDIPGIIKMLSHRPSFWFLPASEWAVFLSVLLWIVLVALHLLAEDKARKCVEPLPFVASP